VLEVELSLHEVGGGQNQRQVARPMAPLLTTAAASGVRLQVLAWVLVVHQVGAYSTLMGRGRTQRRVWRWRLVEDQPGHSNGPGVGVVLRQVDEPEGALVGLCVGKVAG
jgi:hypothetical protein